MKDYMRYGHGCGAQIVRNVANVKKKGRGRLAALLAVILALSVALTGCGKAESAPAQSKDEGGLIDCVQVVLPAPTGPEALVGLQANVALQYYIEARMYLELLSACDENEVDPEEFRQLVDDAVTAFENADKISESLGKTVDLWMLTNDEREAPQIKVLQTADAGKRASLTEMFVTTAYAKDGSRAEMTAQEIVDAFDKAKSGQKIKTLAELLGTDAKHAYAELKIAQATLEGADAMKIAEQATTCIRVAKTLKTAGTVAGLVIAAAPVATGAVATMATGELIATGGGVVMGAVNSGLEIASTGATLYYGTDENKITGKADEIADSDAMKTANLIVGLAGVGYNIKNQIGDMNKLMDQADKLDDYEKLLTSLTTNNGKEASNLFGILSFGLGSIDPNEGTVLGIKMDTSDGSAVVNIEGTEIGTSAMQQEAMKTVLKDTGLTATEAEEAVKQGVEIMESGKKPEEKAVDPAADLPEDTVKQKLAENEAIAPGSTFIDLDDFIENMETFMECLEKGKAAEPAEKEKTAEGGEIWVEPYSHFGAADIVELYKFLREAHPTKMEVTPAYCYNNNNGDDKDFTNKETFVIDMTAGAETVYQTSFMDGDESSGHIYQVTLTFTGDPSDDGKYGALMKVSAKGSVTWRQSGKEAETIDEPDCAVYNTRIPKHSQEKSGGKALHVGNGTPYSVDFIINRICIPQE